VLIDLVVYDGLDEMDALGPLEVLRSASRNADLSVRLVTRESQEVVTGACGLQQAQNTAKILAGVCTGTMLLAHAGVVGSSNVSSHHGSPSRSLRGWSTRGNAPRRDARHSALRE